MSAILLATQVPEPLCGTGVYDLSLGGLGSRNLITGGQSLSDPFNENAARLDMAFRWGGGIYAVLFGLTLSAGAGLTLNIATGAAIIDCYVPLEVAATRLLDDGTRNHLWMRRDGTITHRTDLVAPGTDYVYLGSALTAAGAISSVDTSGVVYQRGGVPWRQTADPSEPGDSPPTTLSFLHEGDGKLWLFSPITGGYWEIAGEGSGYTLGRLPFNSVSGTKTLTAAEAQNTYLDIGIGAASETWTLAIPVAGTPPVAAGHFWIIDNGEQEGLIVKRDGSGDNSQILAPATRGIFAYDGSEIVRVCSEDQRYIAGSTVDTGGSGNYRPNPADVEGDVLSFAAPVVQTIEMPLTPVGRVSFFHCDEAQNAITLKALAEANAERITRLLPGDVQPFIVTLDGSRRLGVARPYTRIAAHNMTSDNDYTLTKVQALHWIIQIQDTTPFLTAGRNIIMPTLKDPAWVVKNATAQTLTFKTAAGTGIAVAAGKHAFIYGDGTNIDGAVFV